MSEIVIRAEGLGKRYRLGQRGATYATLRDAVTQMFKFGTKSSADSEKQEDHIWALKDVDFEVKQGEVLGIIGSNGAGKSTLLKVLSRITEPTEGQVEMTGRVSSLLEVGTGFHPELTGRENIYLNGAILGMNKKEIEEKFDEIVAFSELEKFMDTPVKHYSSGMYVRLAFAVASSLEPEILLVDEVLAVGDANFQKKCLGKMEDVAKGGRTVFFVSHNMTAVSALCSRCILLLGGKIIYDGDVDSTIEEYSKVNLARQSSVQGFDGSILRSARLVGMNDVVSDKETGTVLDLEFEVESEEDNLGIDLNFRHNYAAVCHAASAYFSDIKFDKNTRKISCRIGPVNFAVGHYQIDVKICRPMKIWIEEHDAIIEFHIERQVGSRMQFELLANRNIGFFIPPQQWSSSGK